MIPEGMQFMDVMHLVPRVGIDGIRARLPRIVAAGCQPIWNQPHAELVA